jgi:hypothetical protein
LPSPEVCNGLDDNCDGATDEGSVCAEPCYSGPEGTLDVGECSPGVLAWLGSPGAAATSICHGEVLPKTEICNGADDDCDGATDEGSVCAEPCYSGPEGTLDVGACRGGLLLSVGSPSGATATVCHGEVLPSAEVCNGADDDCDGVVDNLVTGSCEPSVGPNASSPATPNDVGVSWLPDRTGPAHISRPDTGALAYCLAEESTEACASRYLEQPHMRALLGTGAETQRSLAFTLSQPLLGADVLSFAQRHRGVEVQSGAVKVTVVTDAPRRVVALGAFLRPVPLSLSVEPVLSAAEAASAAGLGEQQAALVVWVSYANEAGGTLAAAEQEARLGWRYELPDSTLWVGATDGVQLELRSHLVPDVLVTDVANNGATQFAACAYTSGAGQCPLVLPANPNLSDVATAAVLTVHRWLWDLVGRDGLDGLGDREPPVQMNVNQTLKCQPNWLGWRQPGSLNICQGPHTTNHPVVFETGVHEALHELHGRLNLPTAGTVEREAMEHAYVEATSEFVGCAEGNPLPIQTCDFSHGGRDYDGTPIDPRSECGCGIGTAAACIEVTGANGATPTFGLCPGEPGSALENRRAFGNALTNAACRMAGCSVAQCSSGQILTCAPPEALRAATQRFLTVIWNASPQQPGPALADAASALLSQAQILHSQNRISAADVVSIHGALAKIGLLPTSLPVLPFELCDGLDNDGDGFVDEAEGSQTNFSLTRSCFDAADWFIGVGTCKAGVQACQGAAGWSAACPGQVLPAAEQCNDQDDDCDGQTDEDTLVKYGYDNDGDGFVGAAPPQWACPGALGAGWLVLTPSNLGDCNDFNPAVYPGAQESCLTPGDDNCNGTENEGCPCSPLTPPRYCGPALGGSCLGAPFGTPGCQSQIAGAPSCKLGFQTCEASVAGDWQWSDTCAGASFGGAEVCNGLDDNCDGTIDNDAAGLANSCGYAATGKEVCQAGKVVCVNQATPNGCGGTVPLNPFPGDACGPDNDLTTSIAVCAGPNATACVPAPGGVCSGGHWTDAVPTITTPFFVPPLVKGDGESDGSDNNVDFWMSATLSVNLGSVRLGLEMTGIEFGGNNSTVNGSAIYTLLDYPQGCVILDASFLDAPVSVLDPPPKKWGVNEEFTYDIPGGPAAQFHLIADTGGDEFGTQTGFHATLRPFTVEVCCQAP